MKLEKIKKLFKKKTHFKTKEKRKQSKLPGWLVTEQWKEQQQYVSGNGKAVPTTSR